MSSSRNQALDNIPNYSVRLIQTHRVFDLIQQNVQNPKAMLTAEGLQSFLKRFQASQLSRTIKVMQLLNKQGGQMDNCKFALNLSRCTKQLQLTSEGSLSFFYKQLRDFFRLEYERPYQKFERWDSNEVLTPQIIQHRYLNIKDFYSKLQPYIDGMQIFTFQNSLQQINYCLSIATIPSNELEISNVYKVFMNSTVMVHISQFLNSLAPFVLKKQLSNEILTNAENILKYFKCISYFYTVCKYSSLRQKLETSSCLFYHETFAIITCSLNIPQNRIRMQVSLCLALLSKYIDCFNEWILSNIQLNLVPLLQNIQALSEEQGLYYALICLKNVMICYQQKPQTFRKNPGNQKTMLKVFKFLFQVLKKAGLIQTQKQCILLISQLLKVCPINYAHVQDLKMTNMVFNTPLQIQNSLVPAALRILQVAITAKNQELTNIIIRDSGFLLCIQNCLGSRTSSFYYEFLHIVYLLSFRHVNFLVDKGILERFVKMLFQEGSMSVVTLGSDVIFNIVQQALQNDDLLEMLYQKYALFDRIIPHLFKKCFEKNPFLDVFMSVQNQKNQVYLPTYNYFDKYMLLNIFKTLYCLAVGVSRRHKRFAFSKKLNAEIVKSIANILEDLFKSENRPLIQIILRQKVRIVSGKKVKLESGVQLYKMINIILQQMTYNMQSRPIEFLKIINQEKKLYCNNLLKSQFFQLHQLQIQGISVYITIQFQFEGNRFKRQIPHKFQLNSLKSYLKQFIAKISDIKQSDIKDVILRHGPSRLVENQVQYRTIVNKSIENKVTDFYFQVVEVKVRTKREDLGSLFMISGEGFGNKSLRMQNSLMGRQTSRVIPNSNKFTTLREQPSQNQDPRRNFYSPINFSYSYRDKSPAFGGSGGNRNK